jgi:hypothetical protein
MMTPATRKGDFLVQQQLSKKTRQSKLLIVSDSAERASGLRASLDTGDIEITCLTSLAELGLACRCVHDLAIIDVSARDIVEVLQKLRSSAGCEAISVLVEASRLASDPSLTGVLPTYRAMPCSQADLITLARRRMASTGTKYRIARKML